MKLLRYGLPGQERPGLVDADGIVRDLSSHIEDIDGRLLDDVHLDQLRGLDSATLPEIKPPTRYAPCVANVGKFCALD